MSATQRPNILLILTDQMRGDALGILGHRTVHTPHLDELAHQGFLFTAAYSPCPSCIAARASLFTGKSPSVTGRLGYRDRVPWCYDNMLADVLGRGGYQTHCVGKTHFYPQRVHLGFHSMDSYEGEQNQDGKYVNDYFDWLSERTNGRVFECDHGLPHNSWDARPSHLPEELHNNTWVVTRSIDFLRRRDRTRPFFLNVSFHRPHPPIDPPQVFYDMYRDKPLAPVPVGDWASCYDMPVDDLNAWKGHLPDEILDHSRRAYYAQIAHIDCQVGRLMRHMQRMDLGPTMIVFTSDHGEMLGDHHLFRKTYAYEGSAKVPMIIRLPDIAPGIARDEPVVLQDVYPTLLDAAGISLPSDVEGQSLLPLCQDAPSDPGWRQFIHGEHSPCYDAETGMQFLTDGKEKYIWYTLSGREQFFDLRRDPQEKHDLAPGDKAVDRLRVWRQRMVDLLATRPQDGLSDGLQLLAGTSLPAVRESLLVPKAGGHA